MSTLYPTASELAEQGRMISIVARHHRDPLIQQFGQAIRHANTTQLHNIYTGAHHQWRTLYAQAQTALEQHYNTLDHHHCQWCHWADLSPRSTSR